MLAYSTLADRTEQLSCFAGFRKVFLALMSPMTSISATPAVLAGNTGLEGSVCVSFNMNDIYISNDFIPAASPASLSLDSPVTS